MRVRATVKYGEIVFTSPRAKRAFFDRNQGKDITIDVDDSPTENMRRFFEGAVVPAVFYQLPNSGWVDFRDAREALKFEFLAMYTTDLKGNRQKVARSTSELNKERFAQFVEAVVAWMTDNGMEIPDPDEFKQWRDSAPAAHEIYPQLERLMRGYNEAKRNV